MLTVAEALQAITESVAPFAPSTMALNDALGLTLAADVVSSIDVPPFDKSLMDGYAVRADDLKHAPANLTVIEEVTAGKVPGKDVASGQATRIMTGAPIPNGADAVVRIEETEFDTALNQVTVMTAVSPGTDVMPRGQSLRSGTPVVQAGSKLRPQEIGTLAEQGFADVMVRRRPSVAILATGDELVSVAQTPGPGQIRNSNESMLVAQIQAMGGTPVPLGIARDIREELVACIQTGLNSDILLLSGGVSAGKLDLVPSTLAAAGVVQKFHKVQLKPGKPIWYGIFERQSPISPESGPCCHVFGLPGNPVSSMVCCELFVRTAIGQLLGRDPALPTVVRALLNDDYQTTGDRPVYHPAQLTLRGAEQYVSLIDWKGSADLCSTSRANAMVCFPAGEKNYPARSEVDVIAWSE